MFFRKKTSLSSIKRPSFLCCPPERSGSAGPLPKNPIHRFARNENVRHQSVLATGSRSIGVIVVFILLGAFSRAQELPLAPGAQTITLTPSAGFHNEPSLAVNPQNPDQVVVAWQANVSAAFSHDAGRHWTTAAGVAPAGYRVSGDVSVTFDAAGHVILCYIAFDKLGTASYWGHNATRNGVFVRRSLDGGEHWEPDAVAVFAHPTEPGVPFEDKPYIVADNTRSAHRGHLYIGWTQFSLTKSIILFSRSTDGGKSWSRPIEISTHEGLPRDDNGSVEGFTGTVAPDGTLYVVWADGNDIAFTYSRDGGRSFVPSRSILHTAPPYFQVEGVSRANGFPQIAWGPSPGGRGSGLLYVTWSDYRHGDVDVFCATSRDGGRHWSQPVRVNSDPRHNGADQFFQWLAVDPADGSVNLVFYDRRGDPANQKTVVVLARSTDAGKSFQNYAWTERPFVAREDFLGDYTAITALNGRIYGAWAEEQGPEAGRAAPSAPPSGGSNQAPPSSPKDETGSTRHRTVLRVGTADFTSENQR